MRCKNDFHQIKFNYLLVIILNVGNSAKNIGYRLKNILSKKTFLQGCKNSIFD